MKFKKMRNVLLTVLSLLMFNNSYGQVGFVVFGDPNNMCNNTGICKSSTSFLGGISMINARLAYPTDVVFQAVPIAGSSNVRVFMLVNLSNLQNFQPDQVVAFRSGTYKALSAFVIPRNVTGLTFDVNMPANQPFTFMTPTAPPYSQDPTNPTFLNVSIGVYDPATGLPKVYYSRYRGQRHKYWR